MEEGREAADEQADQRIEVRSAGAQSDQNIHRCGTMTKTLKKG
jgi:hypothetical protein